ncbi:hypothetical protein [Streptomyces mayteni]
MPPDHAPDQRHTQHSAQRRFDRSIPRFERAETLNTHAFGVNMQLGTRFLALLVLPIVLVYEVALVPMVAGLIAGPAAACRIRLRYQRIRPA